MRWSILKIPDIIRNIHIFLKKKLEIILSCPSEMIKFYDSIRSSRSEYFKRYWNLHAFSQPSRVFSAQPLNLINNFLIPIHRNWGKLEQNVVREFTLLPSSKKMKCDVFIWGQNFCNATHSASITRILPQLYSYHFHFLIFLPPVDEREKTSLVSWYYK